MKTFWLNVYINDIDVKRYTVNAKRIADVYDAVINHSLIEEGRVILDSGNRKYTLAMLKKKRDNHYNKKAKIEKKNSAEFIL